MFGFRLMESSFRRLSNEHGTDYDRVSFIVISVPLAAVLAWKIAWRDGQPGLALVLSTYPLLCWAMALLISRRRAVYVRHRELLCTACQLLLPVVNTVQGSLHMTTSVIGWHGGSPLRLLCAMFVFSGALPLASGVLYSRTAVSFNRVVVPLLATIPLLFAQPMCRRVLEVPGVQAPLHTIYNLLGAIHTAGFNGSHTATWALQDPNQECLAVHSWLVVVCGAVMPLVALHRFERDARKHFAMRRQELRARRQEAGPVTQQQQEEEQEDAEALAWQESPVGFEQPALFVYTLSCLVWIGLTTTLYILHRRNTSS